MRDLTYKLSFLACAIQQVDSGVATINIRNDGEDDIRAKLTQEEIKEIESMRQQGGFYDKLVDSIAPSVYGHRDIKSGILLMLFGGVHKLTHEGISLRGDINVCIVGDPSCAKSQFLKYVWKICFDYLSLFKYLIIIRLFPFFQEQFTRLERHLLLLD